MRRGDAQTLADEVHAHLRSTLLSGRFPPGERLLPAVLCAEYDVKPGVLREALTRLTAEQLVVLEPNRGFRVLGLSRQSIEDLLALRRINEGAALRLSVERSDPDHAAAATAALTRLASAPAPERGSAHHDFHLALLSACGNARLLDLCESLFESSELYRRWAAAAADDRAAQPEPDDPDPTPTPSPRDQDAEHRGLLEAVLSGDAELAVRLHAQHLQRTVDLALAFVDSRERVSPSPR